MAKSVIITCAVTGGIHTPTMSPYLPITPAQIAEAAIGARKPVLRSFTCTREIRKPENPIRAPKLSCNFCR